MPEKQQAGCYELAKAYHYIAERVTGMKRLRNLPGGVPEPEELIGRDHLINVLWEQLAGNNILLVAPRRFGKTGVMRHILKKPRSGYLPVYVDVEDISSPDAFATELVALLLQQAQLRKLFASVKNVPRKVVDFITGHVDEFGVDQFKIKLRETLGELWQAVAKRLVLEMEKAQQTVVFIIDEFPQMIDNVERTESEDVARSLLSWFRSLRMKQKDELRRLRFIIGGSTSIDMILRRLAVADKLNDFFRLPVEPLADEDAVSLLQGLAESYDLQLTEEAVDTVFELIGPPVPYFIHLLVAQIILEPTLRGKELTQEDVTRVYHKRILGPTCRGYFDYYRQRLKRYGAPAERAAIAILREISAAPSGRVSDSSLYDVYRKIRKKGASEVEFREIMADLECDWYVSLDTATNEYFFLMDVMKAWWERFYRRVDKKRN
jgi:hypothetical protein